MFSKRQHQGQALDLIPSLAARGQGDNHIAARVSRG